MRRVAVILTSLVLLLVVAVAALVWVSAARARGYDKAVESGKTTVKPVQQFERLFPRSMHSIMYHNGIYGGDNPRWSSVAGIHGGYILTMQMPVTFSGIDRGRIKSHGEPAFYLEEVESISRLPDGRVSISFDGSGQVTFGPAEWTKVVESGGDLETLGIKIKTDDAVAHFEEHWRGG